MGTFFALLGLDWHSRNKKTFLRMLRQDASHYIVPAVFSGLVIYLSLLLRKGDPGINLVDFRLGNGSGSYCNSSRLLTYLCLLAMHLLIAVPSSSPHLKQFSWLDVL